MDFVFKAFFLQFLIFGMLVHVVRPQTEGTNCRGKDYLCLDDVRFQLCVDYGDGQPRTVSDEVQLCPQGTFCSNSGHFECDSFVPPSTTAEPHVDVGGSDTVRPEDGPVSPSEPESAVEDGTLPAVPEHDAEQGTPNEPPTEVTDEDGTNTAQDGVVVVEEVAVESVTDQANDEPSPVPVEVTTNENDEVPPVVTSQGTEVPEVSDVNSTVQDESVPETTVAAEAAPEQTTEESSQSSAPSETVATEGAVDSNPSTAEPSVEPTSQSSNVESTEAPVSGPEATNPAEEEVTSAPEESTVVEEAGTESATEQAPVETEAPTGEATEPVSSTAAPENTESEAPSTVVPEVAPTTEESETDGEQESFTGSATESVTEEESQPEQSTEGVSPTEAGTDEVSTVSGAPEPETSEPEEPQTSSAAPEAFVDPEDPESSSVSSVPSESTPTDAATVPEESSSVSSVPSESTPTDAATVPESSPASESTPSEASPTESTEVTTAAPQTTPGPFVCQTAGRFAHPTDCHKYYLCFWLPFGLYSLEQNCLVGFAYNPTLERCTADQSVCFPGQFTCTGPGRFPDPADPTHYFWCVWNMFGGYLQYNLQCPLGQVFNPLRARCMFAVTGRALDLEPLDDDAGLWAVESPEESTQVEQSDEPSDQSVEPVAESVEPAEPVNPVEPVTPEEDQPKLKVKFQCLEEGTFADPNNCGRYFVCMLKKVDKFKKSKFKCVTGERFDALVGTCVPDVDALCA